MTLEWCAVTDRGRAHLRDTSKSDPTAWCGQSLHGAIPADYSERCKPCLVAHLGPEFSWEPRSSMSRNRFSGSVVIFWFLLMYGLAMTVTIILMAS